MIQSLQDYEGNLTFLSQILSFYFEFNRSESDHESFFTKVMHTQNKHLPLE